MRHEYPELKTKVGGQTFVSFYLDYTLTTEVYEKGNPVPLFTIGESWNARTTDPTPEELREFHATSVRHWGDPDGA